MVIAISQKMEIPIEEAEVIHKLVAGRGLTSKTLMGDEKSGPKSATDLAAGDKTKVPPEQPVRRKKGNGFIHFN